MLGTVVLYCLGVWIVADNLYNALLDDQLVQAAICLKTLVNSVIITLSEATIYSLLMLLTAY